jgi:hypothetical protein
MKIFRNVVAILLFVIAGMFVMDAQFMAFINPGYPGVPVESIVAVPIVQLVMIGVFSVLALVLLVAGAFTGMFRPRIRAVGIVLLAASAFAALSAFGLGSLFLSPQMIELVQQNGAEISASMFRVGPGIAAIAVTALVGAALVALSRART